MEEKGGEARRHDDEHHAQSQTPYDDQEQAGGDNNDAKDHQEASITAVVSADAKGGETEPSAFSEPTSSSSSSKPPQDQPPAKIKVLLMGVGRAPRLAQTKFVVQARDPFRAIYPVLRRLLQLRDDQALFVFVNSAFSPSPEDRFGDLFECFGKTGTLILNYSLDEAWG